MPNISITPAQVHRSVQPLVRPKIVSERLLRPENCLIGSPRVMITRKAVRRLAG